MYHGSDFFFEEIDLSKSQNRRDFGKGFYTTVLEKQAKDWAYRQMLRNGNSKNYVYKYVFEESDDLKIKHFDSLSKEWLDEIRESIPMLAYDRKKKYMNEYGLSEYDSNILVKERPISDYFEKVVSLGTDVKQAANWINCMILSYLNTN